MKNHFPHWKGDNVGQAGVHQWMKKLYGRPNYCEHCKSTTPEKSYAWACKDHKYKRRRSSFMRLCYSCHKKHDIKKFGFNYKMTQEHKEKISRGMKGKQNSRIYHETSCLICNKVFLPRDYENKFCSDFCMRKKQKNDFFQRYGIEVMKKVKELSKEALSYREISRRLNLNNHQSVIAILKFNPEI